MQNLKVINTTKNSRFYNRVYSITKSIPEGRVATYGQIAEILGTKDARRVGWALHANKSAEVPCHRVVDRYGRIAANFAFDGWREQKRRLLAEGVEFVDEMHVDLDKHLFKPAKDGK